MYNFIDTNEASEGLILPSEALEINGEYIENLIEGYRTLHIKGRESLSPELTAFETGVRDGSKLQNKRYPARIITVTYQLIAKTNEEFRAAFNKLASILNVKNARLIFNDEQDKYFIGTPSTMGAVEPGKNSVIGEFEILCADPFKYSVIEYEATPSLDNSSILIDYKGTYKAYPTLEAEFYSENEISEDGETAQALTGSGDCGYIAFFNEDEKIIQLGDPEEADTAEYEKSQTLLNQILSNQFAWGSAAQALWVTNSANVLPAGIQQTGAVAIGTASFVYPDIPPTSATILTARSETDAPYVDYKVYAATTERTADSVNVKVTITTTPAGSNNSGAISISSGAKVTLNKTNIYVSSTTSSAAGTKTGTYYLWDGSVKSGRIRITNTSSNVGKSGQVTGWVNVSDLGLSSASSFYDGIGLKGAIQFGNGGWNYATIKNEGDRWNNKDSHTVTFSVKVKNLEATTTEIEDISFKVERTDELEGKAGVLSERNCAIFDISAYAAPIPDTYYLTPSNYGTTNGKWHGPAISRTIPADAAGDVGSTDFTLTYKQKISIGNEPNATRQLGAFQVQLVDANGANICGVRIEKNAAGKKAALSFYVNGKNCYTYKSIDLSYNNKNFSNGTATINKTGNMITFNICGWEFWLRCNDIAASKVTKINFMFEQYSVNTPLTYNGIYWVKFVKNNCDTFKDIPNKFTANDVVIADCKNGEILLNNINTAALGAMGNDWENFYLTPGLNQIGFSYSEWVAAEYAPKVKVRYREVFI